jgi:hypothetical protein
VALPDVRGGDGERMQELLRLKSLERLYALKHGLERRGIEAQVWHDGTESRRVCRAGRRELRLMVSERDVVRARWLLYGAGVQAWPAENDERERSESLAG